jgi:ATP dependent DNA ligase C terminal region
MRVNKGQEFVIGGYMIGGRGFEALIFGYYDQDGLRFAAKTRNGFTTASRSAAHKEDDPTGYRSVPVPDCRRNAPGDWGQGITAEKMKDCVWLRPLLVGQFKFVEWNP